MEKNQTLNTKNELTSIKQASFVKRLIAFTMDGSLTLFIFFAFYIVFALIGTKAFGYTEKVNKGKELQLASHLYIKEKENSKINTPISNFKDKEVSFYVDNIKYYYTEYKVNLASDKDVKIKNEKGEEVLPKDYYTVSWFNEKFKDVDTIEEARNASNEALEDFSKYLVNINKEIKRIELFFILPPYAISFSTFYIIIPLCFKNGETLGKKTMGLGLVTKDGYDVKKRQIVARQLFLLVYVSFFSFFIGIGITSFAVLAFGTLIYFVAAFISKTNRSFADYICYTYLIDAKNSVWFKDPEEEKQKVKIVENNLEKYNKYEPENKNILQVGSKIVNEEAKKEILESNKAENKQK